MAVDPSTIPTYTDAELLKAVRFCKMQILLGAQSYSIGGRMFTRADLFRLDAIEKELQQKVDAAASGGSIAVARLNRP